MFTFQSQAYYQQIAESLTYPTKAFINNEFSDSKSGKTFATYNPATQEKMADIAQCQKEDLDEAVFRAEEAFDRGDWSDIHPAERKKVLLRWAQLMEDHLDELAVLESLDSGKPIKECVQCDLPETIACLRWYAYAAENYFDTVSKTDSNTLSLVVTEPMGVVATVLPWNFPLMMLAWKVGPALAVGNSMIVKPAELTSLTTLKVAELARCAGLPEGVLNVLPGLGEEVGREIGVHQGIDAVSFTGSTEVGRMFLNYSAQSNLKEITLECGGKSPSVVLSDADNLSHIAEQVAYAAFWNMGENCSANSRLIVHRSLKESLLTEIISKVKRDWKVGNPLDPSSALGAMVSHQHFEKVMGYIQLGHEQNLTCALGGQALADLPGYFIEPTIFTDVSPSSALAQEEIFGPVLSVVVVDSDEQALAQANNTPYGLHASVYSKDLTRALQASKRIKAGTVSINGYSEGDMSTPFGGFKQSGFGGRDKGFEAFRQYTQTKTIWATL